MSASSNTRSGFLVLTSDSTILFSVPLTVSPSDLTPILLASSSTKSDLCMSSEQPSTNTLPPREA